MWDQLAVMLRSFTKGAPVSDLLSRHIGARIQNDAKKERLRVKRMLMCKIGIEGSAGDKVRIV